MSQPNIVMIFSDQQRVDTIGAYGRSPYGVRVKTPNLDKLAQDGIRFDNAYTPCPLCSPARASFLTGTYPHTHKTMTNVSLHPLDNQIGPEDDILFSGLKQAGYKIGYVGKWHVNNDKTPADFGCDDFIGLGDYAKYRKELGVPVAPESEYYETAMGASGTDPIALEHCRPAYLTDNAIRLMEEYSQNQDQPFMVRLDFHGPHFPMVIPEPYASMYDPADIQPIPSFYDDLSQKPPVQKIKTRHWQTDFMNWSDWQPIIAKYFGEVTLLDDQIGRVLDTIDRLGLRENTLVVFSTDHGDLMGAHKIWDKAYTLYDDNTHVPLIARWPGQIAPGSVCGKFVSHTVDIAPTLLDAAGACIPAGIQGTSWVPLFRGEAQDRPDYVVSEFHGSHMGFYSIRMVRTEKYKYNFHSCAEDELYDLENDPYETKNLTGCPGFEKITGEMRLRLVEWMAQTGDHLYNQYMVYFLTGDWDLAHQAPGRAKTKW